MKKLIILLLMLVPFGAMAQTTNGYISFAADSTLNADTVNLVVASANPIKRNHAVTLTLVPVNVTGTATVLAMPQGSLDNVTFFDLQAAADTVNNAGTVAQMKYEYPDAHWRYYRYYLLSSGTGETDFTGELGLKGKY